MKISVVPFYENQYENKVFQDRDYNPICFLKTSSVSFGDEIATVDLLPFEEADCIIFFGLHFKYIFKAFFTQKLNKSIFIPYEASVANYWHQPNFLKLLSYFFPYTITWQDDLVDNERFFKFYLAYYNKIKNEINITPFNNKKLVTIVSANKSSSHPQELYSKRIEVIDFFEKACPNSFDLYGVGWEKANFKSYQGAIENKLEVISHYKFVICFENQAHVNGGVTEKIFDCFAANTVPVYLGADNINEYVPADTFIDYRHFSSNESLLNFLIEMQEDTYNAYLSAIKKFLASKEYEKVSPIFFANEIQRSIHKLIGSNKRKVKIIPAFCVLMIMISNRFFYAIKQRIKNIYFSFLKKDAGAIRVG